MSDEGNKQSERQALILKGNEKRTFAFTEPVTVFCVYGRCSVFHWCKRCERKADIHKHFGSRRRLHIDVLEGPWAVQIAADEPWDIIAGEDGATVVLIAPEAQEDSAPVL